MEGAPESERENFSWLALDELDGGMSLLYSEHLPQSLEPSVNLLPVLSPLHPLSHTLSGGSSSTSTSFPGTPVRPLTPPGLPLERTLLPEQIPLLSWRRDVKQCFEVQCPRCDAWIRTGAKLKPSLKPLEAHMQGRRCNPSAVLEARVRTEAQLTRKAMLPQPGSASSSTAYNPIPSSYVVPRPEQVAVMQSAPAAAFPSLGLGTFIPTNYGNAYNFMSAPPTGANDSKFKLVAGEHILKAMRGVHEELHGLRIVPSEFPCGFCGRPERLSECPYYKLFFYQPSLKSSGTTPCTNVPIVCKIPGCKAEKDGNWSAVWKYNMREHIRVFHPSYSLDNVGLDTLIPLPQATLHDMYISDEEERGLRIPETNVPYKPPLPPLESDAATSGTTSAPWKATGFGAGAKRRRLRGP
ncbi:uncharacterized protein C8Q71DRAFT_853841 [Rhodofomes roseus]|uniref:Uncharacterized protein n=1 Tax=Rhodofomes roseus TaxID=34475 RepID=A0ABQ8KTN6_9APHY|nr:uncharacterized protein C8Q71DRAFT_853841 [Rhodofomes roseus]KAH9841451.1 hypothetical protein C8Q71DRAFT_853841 [Rhodofomes roseus]